MLEVRGLLCDRILRAEWSIRSSKGDEWDDPTRLVNQSIEGKFSELKLQAAVPAQVPERLPKEHTDIKGLVLYLRGEGALVSELPLEETELENADERGTVLQLRRERALQDVLSVN